MGRRSVGRRRGGRLRGLSAAQRGRRSVALRRRAAAAPGWHTFSFLPQRAPPQPGSHCSSPPAPSAACGPCAAVAPPATCACHAHGALPEWGGQAGGRGRPIGDPPGLLSRPKYRPPKSGIRKSGPFPAQPSRRKGDVPLTIASAVPSLTPDPLCPLSVAVLLLPSPASARHRATPRRPPPQPAQDPIFPPHPAQQHQFTPSRSSMATLRTATRACTFAGQHLGLRVGANEASCVLDPSAYTYGTPSPAQQEALRQQLAQLGVPGFSSPAGGAAAFGSGLPMSGGRGRGELGAGGAMGGACAPAPPAHHGVRHARASTPGRAAGGATSRLAVAADWGAPRSGPRAVHDAPTPHPPTPSPTCLAPQPPSWRAAPAARRSPTSCWTACCRWTWTTTACG